MEKNAVQLEYLRQAMVKGTHINCGQCDENNCKRYKHVTLLIIKLCKHIEKQDRYIAPPEGKKKYIKAFYKKKHESSKNAPS